MHFQFHVNFRNSNESYQLQGKSSKLFISKDVNIHMHSAFVYCRKKYWAQNKQALEKHSALESHDKEECSFLEKRDGIQVN